MCMLCLTYNKLEGSKVAPFGKYNNFLHLCYFKESVVQFYDSFKCLYIFEN